MAEGAGLGNTNNPGVYAARVVISAAVGGTASVLAGGKFANGAITAAFATMFNDMAHQGWPGTQSGWAPGNCQRSTDCSGAAGDPMYDAAQAAYSTLSPTAGLTDCWQAECGIGGWVAAAAMSIPGARVPGGVIKGFTTHGVDQAIDRAVSPAAILDAVRNPLRVNPVKYDDFGRPSQRYVGNKAEVVVNPDTGFVVSVNPTSTRKAQKLGK